MNRRQFLFTVSSMMALPSFVSANEKTQLIIYCGVTMAKALGQIAEQFKLQHPSVDVVMLRGGSKDLYENLKTSQVGDLYLSGDPRYVLDNQVTGLFLDSVYIGYNQAAFMVQKGNPKSVKPVLHELLRQDLVTVLSTPDQGAIGAETKEILDTAGLYDAAVAHASLLMADGRSLTQAIQRGDGDLCLNWRAALNFAPNEVELIDLPDTLAPRRALLLTKLGFSQQPALADTFAQFARGKIGQDIMRHYGFLE